MCAGGLVGGGWGVVGGGGSGWVWSVWSAVVAEVKEGVGGRMRGDRSTVGGER